MIIKVPDWLNEESILSVEIPLNFTICFNAAKDKNGVDLLTQFIKAPIGQPSIGRLLIKDAKAGSFITLYKKDILNKECDFTDFVNMIDKNAILSVGKYSLPLRSGLYGAGIWETVKYINGNISSQNKKITDSICGDIVDFIRIEGELPFGIEYYDILRYKNNNIYEINIFYSVDDSALASYSTFTTLIIPKIECDSWCGGELSEVENIETLKNNNAFLKYVAIGGKNGSVGFIGGMPLINIINDNIHMTSHLKSSLQAVQVSEQSFKNPFTAILAWSDNPNPMSIGDMFDRITQRIILPSVNKNYIMLKSGDFELNLYKNSEGLSVAGMKDLLRNEVLLGDVEGELFKAIVRTLDTDEQFILTSLRGWNQVLTINLNERTEFIFSDNKNSLLNGISIVLSVYPDKKNCSFEWELEFKINNKNITLLRTCYPRFYYTSEPDTELFFGRGAGELLKNINNATVREFLLYSNCEASMQYMSVNNKRTSRLFYYGIHDPEGSLKYITAVQNTSVNIGFMQVMIPVENIGKGANSYKLPGCAVWQLGKGDWYDASIIYKNWVQNNAVWIPPMDENGRSDIPEWLKCAPAWTRSEFDEKGEWVEELIKIQ
ncbi:MAG: hypothetical protein K0S55_2072, partial [Clostridia bacterium]|nr:hypothetical protein [Clostridia bacterium]